jgi:hypothetical protein
VQDPIEGDTLFDDVDFVTDGGGRLRGGRTPPSASVAIGQCDVKGRRLSAVLLVAEQISALVESVATERREASRDETARFLFRTMKGSGLSWLRCSEVLLPSKTPGELSRSRWET